MKNTGKRALSDTLKSPIKRPDSEDQEVLFAPKRPETEETIVGKRDYRHGENTEQRYRHCLSGHRPDNQAYQQLCADNIVRDNALADLTAMVREYGTQPATTQPYGPPKILHNKERNAGVGFDVYTVLFILTRR